jgi:hypothetical protein
MRSHAGERQRVDISAHPSSVISTRAFKSFAGTSTRPSTATSKTPQVDDSPKSACGPSKLVGLPSKVTQLR